MYGSCVRPSWNWSWAQQSQILWRHVCETVAAVRVFARIYSIRICYAGQVVVLKAAGSFIRRSR